MTTNQTIDGVPRELRALLERIADPYRREPRSIHLHNTDIAELRALLDAPVVETAGLTAWQKGRDAMRDERDYWMEKCTKGGNPVYQVMSLTDGQGWHDVTVERYQVAKSAPDFNKVRILYDVPAAQPQGEPVAYRYKEGHASWENENPWVPTTLGHGEVLLGRKELAANGTFKGEERDHYLALVVEPLYTEQPAPVAVVMPERREIGPNYPYLSDLDIEWNACLDEVNRMNDPRTPFEIEHAAEPGDEAAFRQWRQERLNTARPAHANPPPGTEPCGTHHDNDGLDEMRKPVCCGSCPGGCVIQSTNK